MDQPPLLPEKPLDPLQTPQAVGFTSSASAETTLLRQSFQAIEETLRTGAAPQNLPDNLAGHESLQNIIANLAMLQQFTLAISQGDLDQTLRFKGAIAGGMKSLQASLRHLTWQTQQIAKGDFKQRVDFMGEFSAAFNGMVAALAQARDRLEQHEAELSQANAELWREMAERKRAQAAEQKAIQREMQLAHNIQMSLLPHHAPFIPGLNLTGVCIPAREVGGDLYGYYKLPQTAWNPGGGWALAVGDVSGKGIPAAMYMAVCTTILATKTAFVADVAQLLKEMNAILYTYMSPNRMNTALCYMRLEPGTEGDYTAHIANAGLVSPILRRGNRCEYLDVCGLPLGVISEEPFYQALTLPLQPGDVMILVSDGIVEAMNTTRNLYGLERLLTQVSMLPRASVQEMQTSILNDVKVFIGVEEPHDDLTLVILKVD